MALRQSFPPAIDRRLKRRVRDRVRRLSPWLSAFSAAFKLAFHRDSYLVTTGFIQSHFQGYPCNRDGLLPWINYNAISFLDERLSPEIEFFEFGSGCSTLYFAERVAHVTSVESDANWSAALARVAPENVTTVRCPADVDGDYCRSIVKTAKHYDVVFIDGDDRVHCAQQALVCLSRRGVMVLDDAQRSEYGEIFDLMAHEGFRVLSFEGLKPKGLRLDRTTLFYRDENCLGI